MKGRIISSLAIFAMAASVNAQDTATSTTTIKKKLPISASFYTSTSMNRNDNFDGKFDGYSNLHILTTNFKPTSDSKIYFKNRYSTNHNKRTDEVTVAKNYKRYERAVLGYSKSGLLNQKDHIFNLTAGVEGRYYPDDTFRDSYNTYGLVRPYVTFTRSLANGISLWNKFYVAQNFRKDTSKRASYTQYYYLITSQSMSLTKNTGISITQEWFMNSKPGHGDRVTKTVKGKEVAINTRNTLSNDWTLSLEHSFSPRVSGAIEYANTLLANNDQRTITKDFLWKGSWGAYINISLF